jgi:hypothetical protein
MRPGSTLIELSIALAILATALAVTLESMVHVSSFAGLHARQGNLDEQCRRISQCLHQDLANTAWFVGYDATNNRQERLFPAVIPGSPKNSYGDGLVFLHLRSERLAGATPDESRVRPVNFITDQPAPMDGYARAPGIRSLILNPAWKHGDLPTAFATPTWETVDPTVSFTVARDPTKLRYYRYVVRPDVQVTGRGVLFREYRDGTKGTWTSDERIADNLVSLTFATNRELPSLNANQVQVSVSLQSDDLRTGQVRARRSLRMIIAMRSGFTE